MEAWRSRVSVSQWLIPVGTLLTAVPGPSDGLITAPPTLSAGWCSAPASTGPPSGPERWRRDWVVAGTLAERPGDTAPCSRQDPGLRFCSISKYVLAGLSPSRVVGISIPTPGLALIGVKGPCPAVSAGCRGCYSA
jgi:hypothetical protein